MQATEWTTGYDPARMEAALRSGGVSNGDIYQAALKVALARQPDARRILDFGAGVGQFLSDLALAYPQAALAAVDIMERPSGIAPAVEWSRADLNGSCDLDSGRFDLIFAIEVVEHLENPRHMMREIHRLLTRGGLLVLTTPNVASLRSLVQFMLRGHFAQFDDANYPAHITPLGPVDLRRIAGETGFEPPHLFYTDSGCIPRILTRRWQDIPFLGPHLRGERFSDNIGAAFRKP